MIIALPSFYMIWFVRSKLRLTWFHPSTIGMCPIRFPLDHGFGA